MFARVIFSSLLGSVPSDFCCGLCQSILPSLDSFESLNFLRGNNYTGIFGRAGEVQWKRGINLGAFLRNGELEWLPAQTVECLLEEHIVGVSRGADIFQMGFGTSGHTAPRDPQAELNEGNPMDMTCSFFRNLLHFFPWTEQPVFLFSHGLSGPTAHLVHKPPLTLLCTVSVTGWWNS